MDTEIFIRRALTVHGSFRARPPSRNSGYTRRPHRRSNRQRNGTRRSDRLLAGVGFGDDSSATGTLPPSRRASRFTARYARYRCRGSRGDDSGTTSCCPAVSRHHEPRTDVSRNALERSAADYRAPTVRCRGTPSQIPVSSARPRDVSPGAVSVVLSESHSDDPSAQNPGPVGRLKEQQRDHRRHGWSRYVSLVS